MRLLHHLAFALALLVATAAGAANPADADIEMKVQVDGDAVRIDASFTVAATPEECWAAMTDFERLPEFISNLKLSKVLARDGNTVRVAQKGVASAGPLTFEFESVRELELTPPETIRSRMVSGNMKKFEGVTRLAAEGDHTRVRYHSDAISAVWIPPLIGRSFIESETREQFGEMRREILRRKADAARPQ